MITKIQSPRIHIARVDFQGLLECAACLDASVAKRIAKGDRIHSGKQLLLRIVAMLTRLVERFDPGEFRVRQDEPNA